MSGEKRIINGQLAQSKVRGKALIAALSAFNKEATVTGVSSKKK